MSETEHDDDVLGALRALPALPMDAAPARRASSEARAAFEVAHGRGDGSALRLGFGRFVVPLGLAAVVVVYLSWAVSAASALQSE